VQSFPATGCWQWSGCDRGRGIYTWHSSHGPGQNRWACGQADKVRRVAFVFCLAKIGIRSDRKVGGRRSMRRQSQRQRC